ARLPCPLCAEILSSEVERLTHLAAAHRGEAPELFIRGRRLGLEDRIREPLSPTDIALSPNCTRARISVDGRRFTEVPAGAVPELMASKRDALLKVDLENAFDP